MFTFPNRPCASCTEPLTDEQIAAHDESHGADCQCALACDDPECQKAVAA